MFELKKFRVAHERSSMKVGADAMLLGAWAGETSGNFLDVGTGCGNIALMLAQRFPTAYISAIDIDWESVEEAEGNFQNSPWGERLKVKKGKFPEFFQDTGEGFDLIVSNPPYFQSGIEEPKTRRERARHQDSLSVFSLLRYGDRLLNSRGRISVVYPAEFQAAVATEGERAGYKCLRRWWVRNNPNREYRRVLEEYGRLSDYARTETEEKRLTMMENGEPTETYRELCKDFYLKF